MQPKQNMRTAGEDTCVLQRTIVGCQEEWVQRSTAVGSKETGRTGATIIQSHVECCVLQTSLSLVCEQMPAESC